MAQKGTSLDSHWSPSADPAPSGAGCSILPPRTPLTLSAPPDTLTPVYPSLSDPCPSPVPSLTPVTALQPLCPLSAPTPRLTPVHPLDPCPLPLHPQLDSRATGQLPSGKCCMPPGSIALPRSPEGEGAKLNSMFPHHQGRKEPLCSSNKTRKILQTAEPSVRGHRVLVLSRRGNRSGRAGGGRCCAARALAGTGAGSSS